MCTNNSKLYVSCFKRLFFNFSTKGVLRVRAEKTLRRAFVREFHRKNQLQYSFGNSIKHSKRKLFALPQNIQTTNIGRVSWECFKRICAISQIAQSSFHE